MRTILPRLSLIATALLLTAIAHAAGTPSFTVKCMHTGGATSLPKYGTYYFFLPESQVKGYACSVPGRPCQIVRWDARSVVFQTPGESPDTLIIDLSNGEIQQTAANGLQSTFACRQVPNGG